MLPKTPKNGLPFLVKEISPTSRWLFTTFHSKTDPYSLQTHNRTTMIVKHYVNIIFLLPWHERGKKTFLSQTKTHQNKQYTKNGLPFVGVKKHQNSPTQQVPPKTARVRSPQNNSPLETRSPSPLLTRGWRAKKGGWILGSSVVKCKSGGAVIFRRATLGKQLRWEAPCTGIYRMGWGRGRNKIAIITCGIDRGRFLWRGCLGEGDGGCLRWWNRYF